MSGPERLGGLRPFPLRALPDAADEAGLCVDGVCAVPQAWGTASDEADQSGKPKMITMGEPLEPHNPEGLPDITATS